MTHLDHHSHLPSFRRTRIAPTPSGFLHLGNVYSFALTSELAKKSGASVLLRIDDMDRERGQDKYVEDIFDTLHFVGIPWQEGPENINSFRMNYSQELRLGHYNQALHELRMYDRIFACECSRAQVLSATRDGGYPGTCLNKQLSPDQPGVTWRVRTSNDLVEMKTPDGVVKTALPPSQRYFVVRRSNERPAYQITSLVDDVLFNVDLIVRGNDLLDSTLAQLQLATFLKKTSFLHATFYHHGLLTDETGLKLSKSAGATSIQYLRREGRSAEEIFSMIEALALKAP